MCSGPTSQARPKDSRKVCNLSACSFDQDEALALTSEETVAASGPAWARNLHTPCFDPALSSSHQHEKASSRSRNGQSTARIQSASETEGDWKPAGRLTAGVVSILLSGGGGSGWAGRDPRCKQALVAGSRGMEGISVAR